MAPQATAAATGDLGNIAFHGESTRDRSRDRPGLDHRVVSGVVDRATQIPCAVSAIAVPLRRAGLTVASAAGGGDELLRHRWIGVLDEVLDSATIAGDPARLSCRTTRSRRIKLDGYFNLQQISTAHAIYRAIAPDRESIDSRRVFIYAAERDL
jgi:hypothetical protein